MKKLIGFENDKWIVGEHVAKKDCPWKSHDTGNWVTCKKCGHQWLERANELKIQRAQCPECNPFTIGRGHIDISFIGRRFGSLVVDKFDKPSGGTSKWWCYCDCGNYVSVRKDHLLGRYKLKNGRRCWEATRSCGCQNKSLGERTVQTLLENNLVNFTIQYIIPELSRYMKFDFAIYDNDFNMIGLIEYDGVQHFIAVEQWGDEGKLEITQERDRRKNEYCQQHQIPLLRIPYTDLTKLNWEYLITNFPIITNAVSKDFENS